MDSFVNCKRYAKEILSSYSYTTIFSLSLARTCYTHKACQHMERERNEDGKHIVQLGERRDVPEVSEHDRQTEHCRTVIRFGVTFPCCLIRLYEQLLKVEPSSHPGLLCTKPSGIDTTVWTPHGLSAGAKTTNKQLICFLTEREKHVVEYKFSNRYMLEQKTVLKTSHCASDDILEMNQNKPTCCFKRSCFHFGFL